MATPTSRKAVPSPSSKPGSTGTAARKAAVRKPKAQAAATAPAKASATPAKPVVPAQGKAPKKPKLVRDSFTIPKPEYLVIDALKERAAKLGQPAKKSEVLRAGIKALAAMNDAALSAALAAVPAIKTGRPKSGA